MLDKHQITFLTCPEHSRNESVPETEYCLWIVLWKWWISYDTIIFFNVPPSVCWGSSIVSPRAYVCIEDIVQDHIHLADRQTVPLLSWPDKVRSRAYCSLLFHTERTGWAYHQILRSGRRSPCQLVASSTALVSGRPGQPYRTPLLSSQHYRRSIWSIFIGCSEQIWKFKLSLVSLTLSKWSIRSFALLSGMTRLLPFVLLKSILSFKTPEWIVIIFQCCQCLI